MKCNYDKSIKCEKENEWKLYYQRLHPPIDIPCKNCHVPEKIKREGLESKFSNLP